MRGQASPKGARAHKQTALMVQTNRDLKTRVREMVKVFQEKKRGLAIQDKNKARRVDLRAVEYA